MIDPCITTLLHVLKLVSSFDPEYVKAAINNSVWWLIKKFIALSSMLGTTLSWQKLTHVPGQQVTNDIVTSLNWSQSVSNETQNFEFTLFVDIGDAIVCWRYQSYTPGKMK